MGYFPFFMDIEGMEGLVIGGGRVAARKVRVLLSYGARLTVVAPSVCEELGELASSGSGLRMLFREACAEDLKHIRFCLVATDSPGVNEAFRKLCAERGIPVNVATGGGGSDFLFPALVRRGTVTVAVTTEGNSPAVAAWVRGRIEEALPEDLGDLTELMGSLRESVRDRLCRQEDRAYCLKELWEYCLKMREGMTGQELERAAFARLEEIADGLGEENDDDQNRNQGQRACPGTDSDRGGAA